MHRSYALGTLACGILLFFVTFCVTLGIGLVVVYNIVFTPAVQQAFGVDVITSPSDVNDEDKIHSVIPCDTAIALTWYKDHLDSDEKRQTYELIDAAIQGRRGKVAVPNLTYEETSECFWAVIYDHPEYFWVDKSYTFYESVENPDRIREFGLIYHMTDKAEIESKLRDYELITDAIIAGTPVPQTDSGKLRQIYTWICYNTAYEEGDRDQDMSSVFEGRTSVCAGYVQALQFMALRAGIPCVRVSGHGINDDGEVSDGNHTWVAMVPGRQLGYYDITWDDKTYNLDSERYYGISQEELEESHVFESDIAPRNNADRDDTEAVVTSSYNISTGEHLELSAPVDLDMSAMFDAFSMGLSDLAVIQDSPDSAEQALARIGTAMHKRMIRHQASTLVKMLQEADEDSLLLSVQEALAQAVVDNTQANGLHPLFSAFRTDFLV